MRYIRSRDDGLGTPLFRAILRQAGASRTPRADQVEFAGAGIGRRFVAQDFSAALAAEFQRGEIWLSLGEARDFARNGRIAGALDATLPPACAGAGEEMALPVARPVTGPAVCRDHSLCSASFCGYLLPVANCSPTQFFGGSAMDFRR